jgi:hypothetical protein
MYEDRKVLAPDEVPRQWALRIEAFADLPQDVLALDFAQIGSADHGCPGCSIDASVLYWPARGNRPGFQLHMNLCHAQRDGSNPYDSGGRLYSGSRQPAKEQNTCGGWILNFDRERAQLHVPDRSDSAFALERCSIMGIGAHIRTIWRSWPSTASSPVTLTTTNGSAG